MSKVPEFVYSRSDPPAPTLRWGCWVGEQGLTGMTIGDDWDWRRIKKTQMCNKSLISCYVQQSSSVTAPVDMVVCPGEHAVHPGESTASENDP